MSDSHSRRATGPNSPIPSGDMPQAADEFSKTAASLNRVLDACVQDVVSTLASIDSARADGREDLLETLSTKLESMTSNLQEVSELIHVAMQGASVPIGSSLASVRRPVDIAECVQHACDVVKSQTHDLTLRFTTDIPANMAMLPSGPLYAAVLAGLRHAVRSIQSAGGNGSIRIVGRLRTVALPTHNYDAVEFVIEDDGAGPVDDDNFGGIISLCKAIVSDAGGSMHLQASTGRAPRAGSVLKFNVPKPIDWGSVTLGNKKSA